MPLEDHNNRLTAYSNNGQSLRELLEFSDSLNNFREALQFTDFDNIRGIDVWLLNCMIAVMAISTNWKEYEKIENFVLQHFLSTNGLEADARIDLYTFGLQRYASLSQSLQAAELGCPFFPLELESKDIQNKVEYNRDGRIPIRIGTVYSLI